MHSTARQQSLAILGGLLHQSFGITSSGDCRQWGKIVQLFIEVFESQKNPILPSLLTLKESTYRRWIHLVWSSQSDSGGKIFNAR